MALIEQSYIGYGCCNAVTVRHTSEMLKLETSFLLRSTVRFLLEGKLKVRFLLVCFWRRVLYCYIFALVRFSRHPKLFFFHFKTIVWQLNVVLISFHCRSLDWTPKTNG